MRTRCVLISSISRSKKNGRWLDSNPRPWALERRNNDALDRSTTTARLKFWNFIEFVLDWYCPSGPCQLENHQLLVQHQPLLPLLHGRRRCRWRRELKSRKEKAKNQPFCANGLFGANYHCPNRHTDVHFFSFFTADILNAKNKICLRVNTIKKAP